MPLLVVITVNGILLFSSINDSCNTPAARIQLGFFIFGIWISTAVLVKIA